MMSLHTAFCTVKRFSFNFLLVIHRIQHKIILFPCSCGFMIISNLKMNPDKRRTIESFFISSNKNPRNVEEQTESNVIISTSLSSSEAENLLPPPSVPSLSTGDQTTCDLVSNTSSSSLSTSISLNERFEAKSAPNDISVSCCESPVQPNLTRVKPFLSSA